MQLLDGLGQDSALLRPAITALEQARQRARAAAPVNHGMAVRANNGKVAQPGVSQSRAVREALEMMNVSEAFANVPVHFQEVKATAGDLALQMPASDSQRRLDLGIAQLSLPPFVA